MSDPAPLRGSLRDSRGRSVEQLHARRDELLAKIEDEELIPSWCWTRMMDTVGKLTDLGDELAWVVCAYLSFIVVRGESMFQHADTQDRLFDKPPATTMLCPCGHDAPTDPPLWRNGKQVQVTTCDACGLVVAMFNEQPYDGSVVVSRGVNSQ